METGKIGGCLNLRVALGPRGRQLRDMCFLPWSDENVLKLIMMVVLQTCEYSKATELYVSSGRIA